MPSNNNVVPGTAAPVGTDPASLIPAAHLPGAVQTVIQGGKNDPNVLNMLRSMQGQINALMSGQQMIVDQPDVILVNAGGRVVEVTGELAAEYLAKPGFRKATEEEEINYRKAMLRQTPEYLRRLEKKRLQDESKMFDDLEAEDASSNVATADLLKTKVTDAQKSGTPEPVSTPQTETPAPVAPATPATTDNNTPVPSRRAAKVKA